MCMCQCVPVLVGVSLRMMLFAISNKPCLQVRYILVERPLWWEPMCVEILNCTWKRLFTHTNASRQTMSNVTAAPDGG